MRQDGRKLGPGTPAPQDVLPGVRATENISQTACPESEQCIAQSAAGVSFGIQLNSCPSTTPERLLLSRRPTTCDGENIPICKAARIIRARHVHRGCHANPPVMDQRSECHGNWRVSAASRRTSSSSETGGPPTTGYVLDHSRYWNYTMEKWPR